MHLSVHQKPPESNVKIDCKKIRHSVEWKKKMEKGKYKSFKPLNTGFYVVNKVVSKEHGQNNNKKHVREKYK